MSLSRKILVRNAILLCGLLVLGGTALAGMLSLWGSVLVASDEYTELRTIEAVVRGLNDARYLLRPPAPDKRAATEQLIATRAQIERFKATQRELVEGPETHESEEDRAIRNSQPDVQMLISEFQNDPSTPVTEGQLLRLQAVVDRFGALAQDADRLVASTQRRANRDLRRATLAIAVVFLLIVGAAMVISVLQYRGIVRPLEALRHAARRIASGRFEQRVPVNSEKEFAELASDFNHMAAQLDDLYRTLERKVEQKSRELVQSERLASVGFLAAGVAHEINNPLGIMAGYAELSLKRLQHDKSPEAVEDARQTLAIICDESFRCREITERLLTLARDRAGREEPVPLGRLVHEVVRMVRVHKSYKGRQIEVELPRDDELIVRGNEAELKQVLLNLIVNAFDATSPVTGQVRVTAGAAGEHVVLKVIDNGCGMTPEVLGQVFEPFFSSKHQEHRGIGLGLSITRAIIEGCGGKIHAASDGPRLGSQFTISLQAFRPGSKLLSQAEVHAT